MQKNMAGPLFTMGKLLLPFPITETKSDRDWNCDLNCCLFTPHSRLFKIKHLTNQIRYKNRVDTYSRSLEKVNPVASSVTFFSRCF